MQVTITSIKRTPRVSKKNGKPFVSVSIQTDKHEGRYLSGFANVDNADWEVGTVANIEAEQKGDFLNFTVPKDRPVVTEFSASSPEIKNLLTFRVIPMLTAICEKLEIRTDGKKYDYPEMTTENDMGPLSDSENLPF